MILRTRQYYRWCFNNKLTAFEAVTHILTDFLTDAALENYTYNEHILKHDFKKIIYHLIQEFGYMPDIKSVTNKLKYIKMTSTPKEYTKLYKNLKSRLDIAFNDRMYPLWR